MVRVRWSQLQLRRQRSLTSQADVHGAAGWQKVGGIEDEVSNTRWFDVFFGDKKIQISFGMCVCVIISKSQQFNNMLGIWDTLGAGALS